LPLETATYLHDLVVANPAHTDGLSQADSHMRLLKSTLQNTFPNFTSAALASTQAQIDAAVAATPFAVPTGAVMDFAMATAPTGWLACDGQAISRTTYAALFTAIGTTWGVGDGSTTFNVPPLQSYFRRHRQVAGLAGVVGTLQNPSNLTHTHAVTGTTGTESVAHQHTQQGTFASGGESATHYHLYSGQGATGGVQGGSTYPNAVVTPGSTPATGINSNDHTHNTTIFGLTTGENATHTHALSTTSATGSADASEARPYSAAFLACIKT
jgi:microcystin-dependent protein